MKEQFNSFHLNVHTLGFHPQIQKVQPHYIDSRFGSGSERVKEKENSNVFKEDRLHV